MRWLGCEGVRPGDKLSLQKHEAPLVSEHATDCLLDVAEVNIENLLPAATEREQEGGSLDTECTRVSVAIPSSHLTPTHQ